MSIANNIIRILLLVLGIMSTAVLSAEVLTTANVLQSAGSGDWRTPDPANLLYLRLDDGEIVFELAPGFAPAHLANIRRLVAGRYFDGLAIIRSQDNYVVQWGDPDAGTEQAKDLGDAKPKLEPEFYRQRAGLEITVLDSRDAYADEVGFVDGFPVASDGKRAWLSHCYGMLGVGRDIDANSGNGAEMYLVTGHAPRHLDRNVTLIGRVLKGIEHLTTLPRGTGPLGMYETREEHVPIRTLRFGDELPGKERLDIEVMRTDTTTFTNYVRSRTFRVHEWFVDPAGRIELCNVSVPVRIIG